tara:strand:- start:1134 stop:1499 length:366 start_codon:yes stop_codon:yes gene_type:complete
LIALEAVRTSGRRGLDRGPGLTERERNNEDKRQKSSARTKTQKEQASSDFMARCGEKFRMVLGGIVGLLSFRSPTFGRNRPNKLQHAKEGSEEANNEHAESKIAKPERDRGQVVGHWLFPS